jgi:alkylation response protein AidB-like acyl-CoA dehydrogenase
MSPFLTEEQSKQYSEFQQFAAEHVTPYAAEWDEAQQIPDAAVTQLGRAGFLGAIIPPEYGGKGWDTVTFGLLNEALGRADSAYTGIITVQSMLCAALLKWGTPVQRQQWLPPLAEGELIGAFALTEPGAGSDIQSIATEFRPTGRNEMMLLNGEKKWITFGQKAGVFLVFGKFEQQPLACLVPRETPGLEIEPIQGLMGFRAAGLARLVFHDVQVPAMNLIGKPGFGLSHVAPVGLQYGRISTACSALGLLRACVEESTDYAVSRKVGGQRLGDIGMIQTLVARMGTELEAARLLCWSACRAGDDHVPETFTRTFIAKYFTSRAAVQAASDAVQIRGASGCHESSPVARYYRSCKILEIIEGTTQIHEMVLARNFVHEAMRRQRASHKNPAVRQCQPAS